MTKIHIPVTLNLSVSPGKNLTVNWDESNDSVRATLDEKYAGVKFMLDSVRKHLSSTKSYISVDRLISKVLDDYVSAQNQINSLLGTDDKYTTMQFAELKTEINSFILSNSSTRNNGDYFLHTKNNEVVTIQIAEACLS